MLGLFAKWRQLFHYLNNAAACLMPDDDVVSRRVKMGEKTKRYHHDARIGVKEVLELVGWSVRIRPFHVRQFAGPYIQIHARVQTQDIVYSNRFESIRA